MKGFSRHSILRFLLLVYVLFIISFLLLFNLVLLIYYWLLDFHFDTDNK